MPRRLARALWNRKCAAVESLVEDRHARPVEEQNLQRVASLAEEEEERTASCVVADLLFRESRQPVKAETHIHGLKRNVDLDAGRNHRAPPSAAATCRRSSASKPRRTMMRASPTATSTSACTPASPRSTTSARDCRRTTRAITAGFSADSVFSRLAQ